MQVETDEEEEGDEIADFDLGDLNRHDLQGSPESNDPLSALKKVLDLSVAQGIPPQAIREVVEKALYIPGVEPIDPLNGEENAEPIELN